MSSLARGEGGAGEVAWYEQPWVRTLMSGQGIGPALPATIYLVVFLVIPLSLLFSFAFLTVERSVVVPGSLSLSHFAEALGDDLFWKIAWRSFWVGALATILCLLLAYPVAYLYTRLGSLQQKLLLVAVVAPLLTSALVRTYAWIVILGGRRGLLNSILLDLGIVDRPLRVLNTDWGVLIGMTQIHLPFMILPLIAVLVSREADIESASMNLGASRLQTFFKVTLPLSVPGITAGVALVFALSYTNFIIPQLLGGGNYTTLAVQVYEFIVVILDWTKGAVRASLLLLSCFVFVFLISWVGHRATRWSEGRAR
ncbi:MAG: ABC transporter permease [Alphaproteobacteria bacterium]